MQQNRIQKRMGDHKAMIIIARGNGKTFLLSRLSGLLGVGRCRTIDNCTDYELKFVYDNHQDAGILLVLSVVDGTEVEPWISKFEKKFNIPVCLVESVNQWR